MTNNSVIDRPSARRVNYRWRVVDIIIASVLGVAFGVVFFGWNFAYAPITAPLEALIPGAGALFYGVWVIAGVIGGLVVRKPGAALFTEVVAASVSALLGAKWGWETILSGLVQGLGAEIVFAAFLYSSWRIWVAILAGAGAGLAMAINDFVNYYAATTVLFKEIYGVSAVISGAVIAGLGSWLLVRALAKTGALSRFAAGRETTVNA
jgi:energy-coupling factor transport system substrate-specific component